MYAHTKTEIGSCALVPVATNQFTRLEADKKTTAPFYVWHCKAFLYLLNDKVLDVQGWP